MNAKAKRAGSGKLDWQQIKDLIAYWTGLERDALHIYAALVAQIGAALLLRRGLAHWTPWVFVLALAGANELLDMFGDWRVEPWEYGAALHDLWNTMLLPTLLVLLVRFAPRLLNPAAPSAAPGPVTSSGGHDKVRNRG